MVSILVLLEIALEECRLQCARYQPHRVSILVLLEIALEVFKIKDKVFVITWFQSLFYWKLLWKDSARSANLRGCTVSILVLLEIALEVFSFTANNVSFFNMFQSLFYWKLLWKFGVQRICNF